MLIRVKLFASYREMVGRDQVEIEIAPGGTVGDALDALGRRHPVLAEQAYAPLAACNLTHVGLAHPLREGDELAIFPPVSGG